MTMAVMLCAMIAGAILQTLSPVAPVLGGARAPFLLSVVLYYALTRERRPMLTASILAGVVQDSLSRIPLGYSCVCFCAVGLVVNAIHEMLFNRSLITHVLCGALAAGAATAMLFGLLARGGLVGATGAAPWVKLGGTALLGMATTPLVFRVMDWLDQRLGNVRTENA